MTYKYSIHDKVNVISDFDCFHDFFKSDNLKNDVPTLEINTHKSVPFDNSFPRNFGNQYHTNGRDIYYDKRFMGQNFELLLEGISDTKTSFHISNKHLRRVQIALPMTDLYAFNHYLRALLFVKLIQADRALVHSSCIEVNGKGLMFTGFPDTGKTLTAIKLLEKFEDGKLLSDDLNLVSRNSGALTYEPVSSISINTASETALADNQLRAINLRKRLNGIIKYITYLPYSPDTRKLGVELDLSEKMSDKIGDQTTVDNLYFLERGDKNDVVSISQKKAEELLIPICERELYFLNSNNIIMSASYVNEELSYKDLKNRYHEIIQEFLSNVDSYVIRVEDPENFTSQVMKTLPDTK